MSLTLLKSFAAFLVIIILGVSSVNAIQYGDIIVDVLPAPSYERTHGYHETRISITNRSHKDRHQVVLTLPQQSYTGGTVTRTLTIEPSSSITASLFTYAALSGTGLSVEIDGRLQREIVPVDLGGYVYGSANSPSLLISKGAVAKSFETEASKIFEPEEVNVSATGTASKLSSTTKSESSESESEDETPIRITAEGSTPAKLSATGSKRFLAAKSETPVTEWSTSWLGYSGYDGVVLTADEMRTLPEPAATAMIKYVECGGSLLVIGAWRPSQPWKTEKKQDGEISTYDAGFGACMVIESDAITGLNAATWEAIAREWDQSQTPWTTLGNLATDVASANRDLPVTENVNIPVRGLLLIMLLFVILIGPVNLLVLSKKKKRMWLLWTVPLISVLTCVTVSAYTLLSEGWGGRARYLSYTILDERSHRATSIGMEAFYSPLTPGDGLRYGTETEINMQGTGFGYSYDNKQDRVVDWTEDQHLETGWVTARTPAHFLVRRSETRRERLLLNRESNGDLAVVNGLGVSIRNLWLADDVGNIYQASNIPAGASAKLQTTGHRISTGKSAATRTVFAGDWITAVQQPASVGDLTRPRTYIADIESCTFLEEGLKGVKNKIHEARIYGIMKAPDDEN